MGNCLPEKKGHHGENIEKLLKDKFKLKQAKSIFSDDICYGMEPQNKINEQLCPHMSQQALQSDPFQKPYQEELIKGFVQDTRSRISKTLDYPYCAIGLVTGKIGVNFFHGTGCLIGPKIVLTCAHNCFYRVECKQTTDLEFIPAANGMEGKSYKVRKCEYPKEYCFANEEQFGEYDFAILQLYDDLSLNYGFIGIDTTNDNIKPKKEKVQICGYPGDKCTKSQKTMWTASDTCEVVDNDFIYYLIPTEKGQSGSPILKKKGSRIFTIGIHIRGDVSLKKNVGLRLTKKNRLKINEWIGAITGSLDLSNENLGKNVCRLNESWCSKLHFLNLNENKINSESLKQLSAGDWSSLQILKLSNNQIGNTGVLYLKNFPNLTHLQLWECGLTDGEFFPQLPKLEYLCLSRNKIGNEGIVHLKKYQGLKTLFLSKINMDRKGVFLLSKIKFHRLQQLSIGWNDLYDDSMNHLSEFHKLNSLCLRKTKITAEGVAHLSTLPLRKTLRDLDISKNAIEDEGITHLNLFSSLKQLNIIETKVTVIGIHRLERIPHLKKVLLSESQIKEEWKKVAQQLKNHKLQVIYQNS